jgi:hypothetical protein
MKRILACCLVQIASPAFGQNVGIGTATPTGPLSFPSTTGNKIVLWGDGNQSHYGIGIQGGVLQLYANQEGDAIALGYGRSGAFTERVRIPTSGDIGLTVYGRALLRNGTAPLDPAYGAGIWLTDPMNTTLQGFMGVQNSQNIGFYGGTAGWGFTYNTSNSRVGIGNTNPNAPLAFGASLGKKITLYPGTTGDVGMGVSGNRLYLYSDNPNADVALGYDAAGVFNERFAFKPNGAFAVNGSTGGPGQVLQSNGGAAAATWVAKPRVITFNQTGDVLLAGSDLSVDFPGLTNLSFSLAEASTIVYSTDLSAHSSNIYNAYCFTEVQIFNASAQLVSSARAHEYLPSFRIINMNVVGSVSLPPGIYNIKAVLARLDTASGVARSEQTGKLIVQIFPN